MEFISCHITPLVVYSLEARLSLTHTCTYVHTHIHTHTHTHTHTNKHTCILIIHTESVLENQSRTKFKNLIGANLFNP